MRRMVSAVDKEEGEVTGERELRKCLKKRKGRMVVDEMGIWCSVDR